MLPSQHADERPAIFMASSTEHDVQRIKKALAANLLWVVACLFLTLHFILVEFSLPVALLLFLLGIALIISQAFMTTKPSSKGMLASLASYAKILSRSPLLYLGIIAAFILYLFLKIPAFGAIAALGIAAFVLSELVIGIFIEGPKRGVRDVIASFFLVLTLWYGAALILGVPVPMNSIISCSMLPQFERGDFAVLQGGPVNAPSISMSRAEFDSITTDATVTYGNDTMKVKGSMFSYCAQKGGAICDLFFLMPQEFSETKGPLKFQYGTCPRYCPATGENTSEAYLAYVEYKGQRFYENLSNDAVVYAPESTDLNSGIADIIHRAYLRIDVEGRNYYLIKGDNNPISDLQSYDYALEQGNYPVSEQQLRGKVIFRIPLLGYAKLIIYGMREEPEGCDTYFAN